MRSSFGPWPNNSIVKGVEVEVVVGFATKEAVILEKKRVVGSCHYPFDDGTYTIRAMSLRLLIRWDQKFDAIILVEHLACSNMSLAFKFHDHPRAYISMNAVWPVDGPATPVVHLKTAKQPIKCEDGPVLENRYD